MTYNEARDVVIKLFRAAWDEDECSVAYDNASFTPPLDATEWARLSIQFFMGDQTSVGSPNNREFTRRGMVTVSVFTVAGDSTYNNDELVDAAVDIFEGVNESGVCFHNTEVVTVGADAEGKWYQQNVKSVFIFNEIK